MGVGAVDLKRSGPGRHINKAQEILESLAHDPLAIATSPLAEFPDDALIDHWQNLRRDAFFFQAVQNQKCARFDRFIVRSKNVQEHQ